MQYVLTCPNVVNKPEKGLVINTVFYYDNLEDALEHKALCDEWDKGFGKEPTSYITKMA